MTLARAVKAWTAPIAQVRRSQDGIRGTIAKRRFCCGDLLMTVPLSYCYFPHASHDPHRMRRWNRSILLPETQLWLRRLIPDQGGPSFSLAASVSTVDNRVLTVALSPVEAALAVAVALRYFWREVFMLRDCESDGRRPPLRPSKSRTAELYIQALPMKDYLSFGLEGSYVGSNEDEGYLHSSIEQIAWNLRDCILSYASHEEYYCFDANPTELDAALLAAIYVIRARLLWLSVIFGENSASDGVTSAIVPVVDFLNHSAIDYTCLACVALPKNAVVVRAARDINVGEELTLDYRFPMKTGLIGKEKDLWKCISGEDMACWESRYLFSAEKA